MPKVDISQYGISLLGLKLRKLATSIRHQVDRSNFHGNVITSTREFLTDMEGLLLHVDELIRHIASDRINTMLQMADMEDRLVSALETLELAANKFEFYRAEHLRKGTDDGQRKADSNANMAAMCRAAILASTHPLDRRIGSLSTPIMRHFSFDHLPPHLQKVSAQFHILAHEMSDTLPPSAEVSAGLRKLLEAKDCFVRAAVEAHKEPVRNQRKVEPSDNQQAPVKNPEAPEDQSFV